MECLFGGNNNPHLARYNMYNAFWDTPVSVHLIQNSENALLKSDRIKTATTLKMCNTSRWMFTRGLWKAYILGVYLFTLVLESFQNLFAIQDESNLLILLIQFHQHVLNLETNI